MSARRTSRSTRTGLILFAAALGATLLSFALGRLWAGLLTDVRPPTAASYDLRTFWIPLSAYLLDGAIGLLGVLGFAFVWRGREELGSAYASRQGLSLLAFLVAGVAFALYLATGVLLGYVAGVAFLVPWHALLAVIGGVFLGLGLYGVLANLPLAGARPVAAVALALGLAGIALSNLETLGLRRVEATGLAGAGFGLALASLIVWLVLCLWGEETLGSGGSTARASAASRAS